MRTIAVYLLTISCFTAPTLAQNSTQAPPPSATKEGGIAGDPTGAIRSLGGGGSSDFKEQNNTVTIPQLGADGGGASRTGHLPAGTR